MATLVLRQSKGSPLTNTEVDTNFTNLNDEVGTKLASASYTAADVLTKIKTVDGFKAIPTQPITPAVITSGITFGIKEQTPLIINLIFTPDLLAS